MGRVTSDSISPSVSFPRQVPIDNFPYIKKSYETDTSMLDSQ